jgi:integrase
MNTDIILSSPSPLDLSAIERAPLQPSTKKQYKKVIADMTLAGVNPSDHIALQQYADGLKSSRKAFLKSALRLMTLDFEQEIRAGATPENLAQSQAALLRLDAMRDAVQVPAHKGTKAHTWLSRAQVAELMALCSDTLEGKRDWIVLGLLLGAGLRREELSQLTFDALKTQPMKNGGTRVVLEVTGKGNKTRVIPINAKLAYRLHDWRDIVGGGYIARSLGMKQELGDKLSAVSIFNIVRRYGARIWCPELAAHDCRRTFAQLGYESGIPLTQISTLLGHSSVSTTQKYLDLALDIETTASDFIPL